MNRNRILVVCFGMAAMGYGQESFEAASIKPHPGMITYSADPAVKGNRMTATASTLIDLIESAYHLRDDQISGAPAWARADHFDLEATAARAITRDEMRTMLQSLLAERFRLEIHRETREVPMYALVVAKGGVKFQATPPDAEPIGQIRGDGSGMHMEVAHESMATFALRISSNGAGRPVLDQTGLTGKYSFKLNWTNDTAAVTSDLPPLAMAVQEQLGLRLEPTKGPSEFLINDHVERPSAN